jgi:hypothetical protein
LICAAFAHVARRAPRGPKAEPAADAGPAARAARRLDEEIAKSGVRGNVAPDRPARRHRSTRRRQDAPDLPRRKIAPRILGKTFTAPDGRGG